MKIKINGLEWKVYFESSKELPDWWGVTRPGEFTIRLRHDLDKNIVRTTITHELIHAILASYGFTKPSENSDMLFSEEEVCDFIAMNLSTINELTLKVYLEYKRKYNIK